jgi:hypothetical protein
MNHAKVTSMGHTIHEKIMPFTSSLLGDRTAHCIVSFRGMMMAMATASFATARFDARPDREAISAFMFQECGLAVKKGTRASLQKKIRGTMRDFSTALHGIISRGLRKWSLGKKSGSLTTSKCCKMH